MGPFLYRLFLSVGVGLGLIAGQAEPTLAARLLREEARAGAPVALVASVEVESAFSAGSRELVEAGSIVAIRVEVELLPARGEPLRSEALRTLSRDPLNGRYLVGIPAEGRRLSVEAVEAALIVAASFPRIGLGPASVLAEGGRVRLAATMGLVDSAGAFHEAPVLWNYVRPQAAFAFASEREVPF